MSCNLAKHLPPTLPLWSRHINYVYTIHSPNTCKSRVGKNANAEKAFRLAQNFLTDTFENSRSEIEAVFAEAYGSTYLQERELGHSITEINVLVLGNVEKVIETLVESAMNVESSVAVGFYDSILLSDSWSVDRMKFVSQEFDGIVLLTFTSLRDSRLPSEAYSANDLARTIGKSRVLKDDFSLIYCLRKLMRLEKVSLPPSSSDASASGNYLKDKKEELASCILAMDIFSGDRSRLRCFEKHATVVEETRLYDLYRIRGL